MSLEATFKTNSVENQFKDSSKNDVTDVWGYVPGDRGAADNPWMGIYDRRQTPRDTVIEVGDFDFS